jgi:hypothetical protein
VAQEGVAAAGLAVVATGRAIEPLTLLNHFSGASHRREAPDISLEPRGGWQNALTSTLPLATLSIRTFV